MLCSWDVKVISCQSEESQSFQKITHGLPILWTIEHKTTETLWTHTPISPHHITSHRIWCPCLQHKHCHILQHRCPILHETVRLRATWEVSWGLGFVHLRKLIHHGWRDSNEKNKKFLQGRFVPIQQHQTDLRFLTLYTESDHMKIILTCYNINSVHLHVLDGWMDEFT